MTLAMAGEDAPAFVGMWRREGEKNVNVSAYLQAHGLTAERAAERASAPYEQEWRATEADGEFLVLTGRGDGAGPARTLLYPLGEWEEPFKGKSVLFGEEPGSVFRNTVYEEHPEWGRVHLTESVTPLGWETTQRRVEGDAMIVERTFAPKLEDGTAGDRISSKEIFARVEVFKPMDQR